MTLEVAVTDINDHAPVFNQSRYHAIISESLPQGSSILQVAGESSHLLPGKRQHAQILPRVYNETLRMIIMSIVFFPYIFIASIHGFDTYSYVLTGNQ